MLYIYIGIIAASLSLLIFIVNFCYRHYIIVKVTKENAFYKKKIPYQKINVGICIALFLTLTTCTTLYITDKIRPYNEVKDASNTINSPDYYSEYKIEINNITNNNIDFSLVYYKLYNHIFSNSNIQNLSFNKEVWFTIGERDTHLYFLNEDFSINLFFDGSGKLIDIEFPNIILQAFITQGQYKFIQYSFQLQYETSNFILKKTRQSNFTDDPDVIDFQSLLSKFESDIKNQYGQSIITLTYTKKVE